MVDQTFVDLFGDSGSEGEEFLGFADEEIRDEVDLTDEDDIVLSAEDLQDIEREIDEEEHNMALNAYDCNWLMRFTEEIGPAHVGDDDTPYHIFRKFFDDEVIDLLVLETNRYYKQYMDDHGANLPPSSRFR